MSDAFFKATSDIIWMRRRELLATSTEAEIVDLGLSVKWAEGNIVKNGTKYSIGAPIDQGCYFSWGNVEGHNEGEGYTFNETTYNSTPGASLTVDISAASGYDAARVNLGDNWRMPTKDEVLELMNNCTSTWTTQNGVSGMRFTSKKNGKRIFFPASGVHRASLENKGSYGYYWSSTQNPSRDGIYGLVFSKSGFDGGITIGMGFYRELGFTVRAVQS